MSERGNGVGAIGRAARALPQAPEDAAFAARVIASAAATRRDGGAIGASEAFAWHRAALHAALGFAMAAAVVAGAAAARDHGSAMPAFAADPLEAALTGDRGR